MDNRREYDWREYALLVVAVIITGLLAVDIGIRWGEAGTRIRSHCEGDARIYTGSIRGDGVLAINPYDSACIRDQPIYPGDSSPAPTAGPGDVERAPSPVPPSIPTPTRKEL